MGRVLEGRLEAILGQDAVLIVLGSVLVFVFNGIFASFTKSRVPDGVFCRRNTVWNSLFVFELARFAHFVGALMNPAAVAVLAVLGDPAAVHTKRDDSVHHHQQGQGQ